MSLRDLTWSCHFCGDVRPDNKVGVVSKQRTLVGVTMQENRRYCLDRPECEERALAWQRDRNDSQPVRYDR